MMLRPLNFVNVQPSEPVDPLPDYGVPYDLTRPPLGFKLRIEPHNNKVDISASELLFPDEVAPLQDIHSRVEKVFVYEVIRKLTAIQMSVTLDELLRHAFPRYLGIETVWLTPRRLYPGEYEEVHIHSTLPRDPNVYQDPEDSDTDDMA